MPFSNFAEFGYTNENMVNETVTNTNGSSTAFTNFAATAGKKNYVTGIWVFNSSVTARTLDFRDGVAGAVLITIPLPASSGYGITLGGFPIVKTSVNTDLAFDASAAITTLTISLVGYKAP